MFPSINPSTGHQLANELATRQPLQAYQIMSQIITFQRLSFHVFIDLLSCSGEIRHFDWQRKIRKCVISRLNVSDVIESAADNKS